MINHLRDISKIREQVSWLNSLDSDYSQWVETDARKDHVDEFGDVINCGDIYFNKKIGVSWGNDYKLSLKSMCAMIDCLFDRNTWLSGVTKARYEEKKRIFEEGMRKSLMNVNFGR